MTFGMFLPSYRSTVSNRKICHGKQTTTINLDSGENERLRVAAYLRQFDFIQQLEKDVDVGCVAEVPHRVL